MASFFFSFSSRVISKSVLETHSNHSLSFVLCRKKTPRKFSTEILDFLPSADSPVTRSAGAHSSLPGVMIVLWQSITFISSEQEEEEDITICVSDVSSFFGIHQLSKMNFDWKRKRWGRSERTFSCKQFFCFREISRSSSLSHGNIRRIVEQFYSRFD